ncbi:MAG: hypothetical protein HRF50_04040 [Phycisphaerae bacterium]|jgi:DNA-binding response OmpR family regulator
MAAAAKLVSTALSLTREQAPSRARVLVVEPDSLTSWSIRTYLERWFHVDCSDSAGAAANLLQNESLSGLVLSEDLPETASDALEERARRLNPLVTVIRLDSNPLPLARRAASTRLEKPFDLAELARRLGIPETELPPIG